MANKLLALLHNRVSSSVGRNLALWELRRFRRRDAVLEPINAGILLRRFKDSAGREDNYVMQCWRELRDRYPDYAMTSREAIDCLFELKMFDQADEILTEAKSRYPQLTNVVEWWAEVPRLRGDFVEASRRWSVVRSMFPGRARAYTMTAICLKQIGRVEEATALLNQAVELDCQDFITIVEYATVATESADWTEALRRWTNVRNSHQYPRAWIEVSRCLRELGRQDEAIEILHDSVWRFQNDARASIELAWIPHRKGSWAEALQHWHDVREKFPREPTGYIGGAQALRAVGQDEEAETLLAAGVDKCEGVSVRPLIEFAQCAHDRADWDEAIRRWEAVRAKLPRARLGFLRGAEALEAAGRLQEASSLRATMSAI